MACAVCITKILTKAGVLMEVGEETPDPQVHSPGTQRYAVIIPTSGINPEARNENCGFEITLQK